MLDISKHIKSRMTQSLVQSVVMWWDKFYVGKMPWLSWGEFSSIAMIIVPLAHTTAGILIVLTWTAATTEGSCRAGTNLICFNERVQPVNQLHSWIVFCKIVSKTDRWVLPPRTAFSSSARAKYSISSGNEELWWWKLQCEISEDIF